MEQVSRKKKSAHSKFNEQKSSRNKFHEKNQFREKKNQCTSFTKRKINFQKVLLTKATRDKFHK